MSGSAFEIELDEMTLARARRGDMAACETIYRLYQGPGYTIAFRICQCPALAQDVLQEAFVNAFKRLKQFRGDAPFWGWLRRVIINQAISMLRKQPSHETVELGDYHASTNGDEDRVELSTDLSGAFSSLEADDRTVVWLHDVEGYNHAEIAEFFGMTESFSKTRLSRARARLRELLGPTMNPAQAGHDPEQPGPESLDSDTGSQADTENSQRPNERRGGSDTETHHSRRQRAAGNDELTPRLTISALVQQA